MARHAGALLGAVVALTLLSAAGDRASAQPTERAGTNVQWIDVPAAGHTLVVAVARPKGSGPFPAVVILHGVEGFRPHYVELARALADADFIGAAAAWFAGSRAPAGGPGFSDVMACPRCPSIEVAPQAAAPTIAALLEAARTLPGARPDRVGLFGQSRGADAALSTVSSGTPVQALVLIGAGYAGRPSGAPSLMDTASILASPLLILHGTADTVVPVDAARAYEQAVRGLGKPVEARYFDGAVHQMLFRPETQARVREAMITFLRARLVGAPS